MRVIWCLELLIGDTWTDGKSEITECQLPDTSPEATITLDNRSSKQVPVEQLSVGLVSLSFGNVWNDLFFLHFFFLKRDTSF